MTFIRTTITCHNKLITNNHFIITNNHNNHRELFT